jgi:cytochrome d ubiquinol oxidase subunit II
MIAAVVQAAGGPVPLLAGLAVAFAVFVYIVLDGADLGTGMLFALAANARQRGAMADTLLPVWDANETWLVLAGGGIFAMFPTAFAVLLTALYLPIIVMLLALACRGVALAYRGEAKGRQKFLLDVLLCGGSCAAGFCQGVILGAVIHGLPAVAAPYSGGFAWFSGFALACGLGLMAGYAALGASWLTWRTTKPLADRARRLAVVFGATTVLALLALGLWTLRLNSDYPVRWAVVLHAGLAIPPTILLAVSALGLGAALNARSEFLPLLATLGIFASGFLAIGTTIFPDIVPPSLGLAEAAAAHSTQVFVLYGYMVLIPAILIYSTFAFTVFRQKVRAD